MTERLIERGSTAVLQASGNVKFCILTLVVLIINPYIDILNHTSNSAERCSIVISFFFCCYQSSCRCLAVSCTTGGAAVDSGDHLELKASVEPPERPLAP